MTTLSQEFKADAETPAEKAVRLVQPKGGRYTLDDMLFAACEIANPVLVRGFLGLGADPSYIGPRFLKMTPLHMSCKMADLSSVISLASSRKVSLDNAQTALRETPLHFACSVYVKDDDLAAQMCFVLLSAGATQGQKTHLTNETAKVAAKDSGKAKTLAVLEAFRKGLQETDPTVAWAKAQVMQAVLSQNNNPKAFWAEIEKSDVKAALKSVLEKSWCDRPKISTNKAILDTGNTP